MAKISVLSFDVANLIAAGEVVDRPASVLKELLENAIDAGADNITAEVRGGGVAMIRVSDNGCGMSAEDLPVAIRRHATSKIKTSEDLASIATLGFRGEALAAIASVSEIRIITKTQEAENGTMLVADGGRVTDISEVGCADGTTVVVENLFSRVPARRKFLKKDSTETMAAVTVVEKIAMSRPDIAFTLITDGTTRFTTTGDGKLKNTLYALLGRDFAARLLEVNGESHGMRVSGYIGTPDNARNNRNHQNMFINGRYVKSKTVAAAIERAYTSYMAPERFPVCAIFLDIPAGAVDVNVHPAKLEVKFSDERAVFEAVYYALRSALESNITRPELDLARLARAESSVPKGEQMRAAVAMPAAPAARYTPSAPYTPPIPSAPAPQSPPAPVGGSVREALRRMHEGMEESGLRTPVSPRPSESTLAAPSTLRVEEEKADETSQSRPVCCENAETPAEVPTAAPADPLPEYRIIGEAFHCYVILEFADELLLIDKHAAHERIIFEELLAHQKQDGRVASQAVLVPISVKLTDTALAAAEEYKTDLEAVGFTYTLNLQTAEANLTAVPNAISPTEAENLFARMADELAEGRGDPSITEAKRREKTLYQVACKAAIKGGRRYGEEQTAYIISRLLALPDITVCPHGRPVAVKLTKKMLDKQFDRIM